MNDFRRERRPAPNRPTGSLPAEIAAHLAAHPSLVPPGSHVLVALSGGPDSMALLHFLAGLRRRWDLRLSAAHFDHGVRRESRVEAADVVRWAAAMGVVCEVGRPDRPLDRTQSAFREARYRFLARAASAVGATRTVTAHHADDQAETVLFRLLRGGGIAGLAGIPALRGSIARPLLPFRRADLLEYVRANSVPHLMDPSNWNVRWTRVWIRHRVLPLLERECGPDVRRSLVALGRAAWEADRALERIARRALVRCRLPGEEGDCTGEVRIDRRQVRRYDDEAKARVIRALAAANGARLSAGGTRAAVEFMSRGRSGGRVDLGAGLRLGREFEVLTLGRAESTVTEAFVTIPGPSPGHADLLIGGGRVGVRWGGESRVAAAGEMSLAFEVAAGECPLVLRGWRPGDRIRLAAGGRSLKRLFNDRRVPLRERTRIPVLVDGEGRVLWVVGVAKACAGERPAGETTFMIELLYE